MSWNGSESKKSDAANEAKSSARSNSPYRKGILAGLIVVLGAVVAGIIVFNRASTPEPTKRASVVKANKIVEVKPAITNAPVAKQVAKKPKPEKFVKGPGKLQLPSGKVLTFPPPAEGHIRKVYANGHTYECDHLGNFKDVTKRKLFHTAFEANFLALACENKPFIPVFLKGLDQEEVKKILMKDYQPIGDETEEEKAQLKAYYDLKCAVLAYMEEGGNFDDYVDEVASFEKAQRSANAVNMREVMTLYKQGKIAEAKTMVEAANILNEQKGYKPMRLPAHIQAAFNNLPEK